MMSVTRLRFKRAVCKRVSAARWRARNLLMPAASSSKARLSIGLADKICPMRPCSMMA
jgi:hypothetical protein